MAELLSRPVPQNAFFKSELEYLTKHRILLKHELTFLEKQMTYAEEAFGVPKSILWCVLFQESRFDPLLNAANAEAGARGIGQFTENALTELNIDTDQYDERTGHLLTQAIKPKKLPLTFGLEFAPPARKIGRWWKVPKRDLASYFHEGTSVIASAAYLNNRYWQIRRALDTQKISYDPALLWLYASAAYNKGARSIFFVLTQQYLLRGERGVEQLLHNPRLTYLLLTGSEGLETSLKDLWPKKQRERYIEELVRNMRYISACALPESTL